MAIVGGWAAAAGAAPIGPDVTGGVGGLAQDVNLLWVCIGGALVMFMQAGFALVETGFTRKKNAAHTMGMNVAIFGTAFTAFFVVGYALMYGVAALAGAMVLGPRIGKYNREGKPQAIPGHNIPMALLGVIVLLFG